MKIRVSEASGSVLDWAVAGCAVVLFGLALFAKISGENND